MLIVFKSAVIGNPTLSRCCPLICICTHLALKGSNKHNNEEKWKWVGANLFAKYTLLRNAAYSAGVRQVLYCRLLSRNDYTFVC